MRGSYRDFPCTTHPTHAVSLIINIPRQNSTFFIKDEPILTHHNHSKSTVYLRVQAWRCTLHGFTQMYNDMSISRISWRLTDLKILWSGPIRLSPPTTPGKHQSFYSLHNFAFSRMSCSWNHAVCCPFVLAYVTSVAQSCPTLCDPMNRSTPSLPVHLQLPESTQTHVPWVSDAIWPSHSLSSPSPPALNLSSNIT